MPHAIGSAARCLVRPLLAPLCRPNRCGSRRRGFFLIVVLVVVAVATMAVYSFTDVMQAYEQAAHLSASRAQADLLVESGAEMTRLLLSQPPDQRDQSGGVYNNPALFQAVNVVPETDPFFRGNFTIIAPNLDETGQLGGVRFGLQNESARLNLNVLPTLETSGGALTAAASLSSGDAAAADPPMADNLAASLLLALPGMTPDVADAILDWLDKDDEPREFGAEAEYYNTLPSPYAPKNGPLDSVEELLLVRGVTPQLLFGLDANRNGVVDVAEQQMAVADVGSVSSLGWAAYLTIHSLEANKRADGSDRINVNADDLELLYDELVTALGDETWASFIVAYRVGGQAAAAVGGQSGDAQGDESDRGGVARGGGQRDGGGSEAGSQQGSGGEGRPPEPWSVEAMDQVDLSAGGSTQIGQLLDLVGATVTLGEGERAQRFTSPFLDEPLSMALYMPALMGNLTTQDHDVMPGRININECPAELIRGIPMLDAETAEALIEARAQQVEDENRRYETWPLTSGIVNLQQMRSLMPIVTGGGDVYRAQIVGYFEAGNNSSRAEVIIDATSVNPRVISYRELSHLGRGFDLSVLGLRTPDAFAAQ